MKQLDKVANGKTFINAPSVFKIPREIRSEYIWRTNKFIGSASATDFPDEQWEHALLTIISPTVRCPRYEELSLFKEFFWEKDEVVIQVHPCRENYVNILDSLHLWRYKPVKKSDSASILQILTCLQEKARSSRTKGENVGVFDCGTHKVVAIFKRDNQFPVWKEVCKIKQTEYEDEPAIQYNVSYEFDCVQNDAILLFSGRGTILPPKRLV